MKRIFLFLWTILLISMLSAQEYVNITFRHYSTKPEVVRAFVPGTFNNWGNNDNGFISPTDPSLMTYIDSLDAGLKRIDCWLAKRTTINFMNIGMKVLPLMAGCRIR